jgi:hypothetical protein
MKIESRPTQSQPVEPPKPPAAPPKPAATANTAPKDRYVTPQNLARQQQALGNPDASSLRTERLGDGSANCLEQAMGLAGPGDSIVLLSDAKDGVGHALVRRENGSVVDPNYPTVSYQSVGQWQAMNPRYTDPRAVPYSDMRQVLSAPPGPRRDALINGLGLGDVSRRMVADEAQLNPTDRLTDSVTVGTNGEVTFTQQTTLENPEGEFERGRLSGKLSAGPLAETEVSLTWNPAAPRPDGTYEVTLTHSAQAGVQAEGELKLGPYGVSGGVQAGVNASQEYKLNLTQDQLRQVAAGTYPLPSLADPMSLPEGGSLTMSTGAFQNSTGSISYGPLSISSESSQTADYSVALERTGDSTVRVTVGPTATLEERLELGLSFGDVASANVGRDRSVTGSTTASVEFDLSQPAGQQAYENFLRTGQLPTQEGPGIPDTYQEQTLSYQGGLDAGFSLREVVNLEHQFWTEDLTYTTRVDNGDTSVTANGHTSTGNAFEINFSRNPDGTQTLNSVALEMKVPGRTDPVKLTLTGPEGVRSMQDVAFRQMQTAAFDVLRHEEPSLAGASNDEVREWIRGNLDPQNFLYEISGQPGEPGFSYSAWANRYNEGSTSRAWPEMPNLTSSLLTLQEPLDLSMGADFFYGLNGVGAPNDLLSPGDNMIGNTLSYFDLGAQSMPGVTVEGL